MDNSVSNAVRFINAYNQIDQTLRAVYNFKRNMSFNDMIRRAVPLNSIVRKYEDKLIDYARLRNAIIHNSNEERVIAEPHTDVVEEFEKIASILSEPPTVIKQIASRNVLVLDSDVSIKTAMETVAKSGFKCIPICHNETIAGVLTANRLVYFLGTKCSEGASIDDYIDKTPVSEMIDETDAEVIFAVRSVALTVEEALNLFQQKRKLQAIIITRTGSNLENPVGILTIANIIDLNKIVEDYSI